MKLMRNDYKNSTNQQVAVVGDRLSRYPLDMRNGHPAYPVGLWIIGSTLPAMLYSTPARSCTEGLGRALDLFGVYQPYRVDPNPVEADRNALLGDWSFIAKDLADAFSQLSK